MAYAKYKGWAGIRKTGMDDSREKQRPRGESKLQRAHGHARVPSTGTAALPSERTVCQEGAAELY